MSEELYLPLTVGTGVEASYNDGSTFTYTPTTTISGTTKTAVWNNVERWYYNWYAATAEKGVGAPASSDVDGSICPKGWKLPYNYSINQAVSWGALTGVYAGNYLTLSALPLEIYRTGEYNPNGLYYDDGYGRYWSSTTQAADAAFFMHIDYMYIRPQNYGARDIGLNIRCVASPLAH